MGFMEPSALSSNAVLVLPDAGIYHFGVLTSSVHMAWMRAVAGRLEMRYRYSKDIVYNNFPWPEPTEKQKLEIEKNAQGILDARESEKNRESSFADLYARDLMPEDLLAAHQRNDRAVLKAYRMRPDATEPEIVAELMRLYREKTEKQETLEPEPKPKRRTRGAKKKSTGGEA